MAVFVGSVGNDTANAGAGTLAGFTGGTLAQLQDSIGDTFFCSAGNDFISAGDGDDSIIGSLGADTLLGGFGNDTINGGDPDLLDVSTDSIDGGAGDDLISGGEGGDIILGGAGNDTIFGSDPVFGESDVANADFIDGGLGNDLISGDEGSDTILGGAGNDTIFGSSADFSEWDTDGDSIDGGAGADSISGNEGNDTLLGGAGFDTLDGGSGVDALRGGLGNDLYIVDEQGEAVEFLDQGIDTVESSVSYALGANLENLTLTGSGNINGTGNALANLLIGNSGNNSFSSTGGGVDTLQGGLGDDTYQVDASDVVTELAGGGIDTVRTSQSYTLGSEIEKLVLEGATNINGTGNGLANTLTGNTGNNILAGGLGRDTMTGGLGADLFDFNTLTESGITAATRDVITDFAAGTNLTTIDRIDLLTIDANSAIIGDQAFSSVLRATGQAFTAAGQIRVTQSGANTLIEINTDSNFATIEMVIQLTGVTATNINAGDFVL
jgi:Ca2+-binding RTX toxin-like protein